MATAASRPAATGLRTKLVLSYLAVIVGSIIVLSVAVSWAIQNYINQGQEDRLRYYVGPTLAHRIENDFLLAQGNWSIANREDFSLTMVVIYDTDGNMVLCSDSQFNCSQTVIKQSLTAVLKNQMPSYGTFQLTGRDGDQMPSSYGALPLEINHTLIGSMFFSEPPFSMEHGLGFNGLIPQINAAIFIAGGAVTLLAFLLSLFLTRRLTHPLEALTVAAERMKNGQYTERVDPPRAQDEIGLLAQTFNDMADTIEADVNELRRQDQVRRDLIANIAHDLATPLTAIQGFSEALADDVISDPAARQETALRIGREVQRLKRLVADVRQMTLLEAGQTSLDLAPLDMHALVDETLFVIQPECEQANITLHNDIPSGVLPVQADSDRVTQVLLNLLDNARRHTPKNGEISVGAAPKGTFLQVWVTDTGSGIAKDDMAHIFERFYRADRSRTGTTGGSGLGLSIVRAIVNAHGGSIWAESTLGKGTRITFTLPLAEQRVLANPLRV